MLLLDDDDELELEPDEAELALAARLGADGIDSIDARLLSQATSIDQKVAMVVSNALTAGGFSAWDEGCVELHTRRVIALVDAGRLALRGNARKPRWSEIRLR